MEGQHGFQQPHRAHLFPLFAFHHFRLAFFSIGPNCSIMESHPTTIVDRDGEEALEGK